MGDFYVLVECTLGYTQLHDFRWNTVRVMLENNVNVLGNVFEFCLKYIQQYYDICWNFVIAFGHCSIIV